MWSKCRHCGRDIIHDRTLPLEGGGVWEMWIANRGKSPRWWCDSSPEDKAVHQPV